MRCIQRQQLILQYNHHSSKFKYFHRHLSQKNTVISRFKIRQSQYGTDNQQQSIGQTIESLKGDGEEQLIPAAEAELRGYLEPGEEEDSIEDFVNRPLTYEKALNDAMGVVDDQEFMDLVAMGKVKEAKQDIESIMSQYEPNVQNYFKRKLDDMENREKYPPVRQHIMTLYYLLSGVCRNNPYEFPPYFLDFLTEQQYIEMSHTIVTGITSQIGEVENGFIFINFCGGYEGSFYALEAIDKGAVAIFGVDEMTNLPDDVFYMVQEEHLINKFAGACCDIFRDSPSKHMTTVGVFGSYGKTTTTWFLRGMMEAVGQTTGMIGSIEYSLAEHYLNEIGMFWEQPVMDKTAFRDSSAPFLTSPYEGKYYIPDTFGATPDYEKLHKLFSGIKERGAQSAVLECSYDGIMEGWTDSVHFKVVVFSNFYPEKTMPQYDSQQIQQKLYDQFTSIHKDSIAVLNIDDPYIDALCEALIEHQRTNFIRYSFKRKTAEVSVEVVKYSTWDTEMIIRTPYGRLQIITPLIGKTNVYNVLATVATGIALEYPLQEIVRGIEEVTVVPGRTEIIDEGQDFPVIVDNARTPDEVLRLLDTVRACGAKRIFLVVGTRGNVEEEEKLERADLGAVVHHKADFVIFTNDNPRDEDPREIIEDVLLGLPEQILDKSNIQDPEKSLLQDVCQVEWYQEADIFKFQKKHKRHVIEDRFLAIRSAIGTAYQKTDVVIVVGKGHLDFQEYYNTNTEMHYRSWFDDRVECRNSLSNLKYLQKLDPPQGKKPVPRSQSEGTVKRLYLDRRSIPWQTVFM